MDEISFTSGRDRYTPEQVAVNIPHAVGRNRAVAADHPRSTSPIRG